MGSSILALWGVGSGTMASSSPNSAILAAASTAGPGSPSGPGRTWLEIMISLGSRPTSAQCWWSTSTLCLKSSTVPPTKFQCWAKRAAVRSVRFSPLPPMQIGTCGFWGPLGSQRASVSV